MKKLLSLIMVGILIVSGLGTVALPVKEVKDKEMTLSFSHLLVKEKNNCVTLGLDGADLLLVKNGYYIVPTKIETFSFPFGTRITDVQCTPWDVHDQVLVGELMVTPDPVIAGYDSIGEKTQRSTNPVSVNSWYDYDVGCGINNNKRCVFVKVQVFPVQYYPSENMIKWAKDIKIDIKYKEPDPATVSFDSDYSFIVLTPSKYTGILQPLIDHKNNRGISTKLVTLDEIYSGSYFPVKGRDNPEKIKHFIKDALENWGTSFVLLVGGSEEFPTRATHIKASSGDTEVFVSDLYYADVYNKTGGFSSWDTNNNNVFGEYNWGSSRLTDEVDLYPDVAIGRLACITKDQVTTYVNKVINYESDMAYAQDWFTNLVVVGGDSFPDDNDAIDEGEYVNEAVVGILDGFIPCRLWESNGKLSGLAPSGTAAISAAINEGCGFVDFSGHGNTNIYATHPYNDSSKWLPTPYGGYLSSNVMDLKNGEMLPIVITGACSVGKFNKDPNCFAWSFLASPNGGGIASCGATGLGYAYTGKYVTHGLIEKMATGMFNAYKNGAGTFGEMWVKAINNYMSFGMGAADYKTVEEWEPFGDPTLAIADGSQAPVKPDAPKGPNSTGVNVEHTYTASTTDPEGDKIYYLFDWGDGEFSGWVGPYNSGQTAKASHVWTGKGDYQIRVKAKDDHGVQSEWSDPLPVTMPMNKQLVNTPFYYFLERLLHSFPILRNLCGFVMV